MNLSYLCGLKTNRLLRMKPLPFTLLFLTAFCLLSCKDRTFPPDTSDSVQVFSKTRYPFPAIKDIIDHSTELSEFPDSTFFDTVVPKLIEDTSLMAFFIQNRESYYDPIGNRHYCWSKEYTYCDTAKIRHNIRTDDVATHGFAEYGWVNTVYLKLENPYKVFDCGKLTKENMIFLFIRIYDLESHIYYLLSFDKNYNFLSSMCLYGYPVFEQDKFFETGELNEKKISNSFLNYSLTDSILTLNIEGSYGDYLHYYFTIDNEGFIILYDIIHIEEEGEITHLI